MKQRLLILFIIVFTVGIKNIAQEAIQIDTLMLSDTTHFDKKSIMDTIITTIQNQINKGMYSYTSETGQISGFYIIDLVDTSNYQTSSYLFSLYDLPKNIIEFKNKHIYLFGSDWIENQYRNVLFINNEKLIVFKSINCKCNNGDDFEEMIMYFEQILFNKNLTERLKNYKQYGYYIAFCGNAVFHCVYNCKEILKE